MIELDSRSRPRESVFSASEVTWEDEGLPFGQTRRETKSKVEKMQDFMSERRTHESTVEKLKGRATETIRKNGAKPKVSLKFLKSETEWAKKQEQRTTERTELDIHAMVTRLTHVGQKKAIHVEARQGAGLSRAAVESLSAGSRTRGTSARPGHRITSGRSAFSAASANSVSDVSGKKYRAVLSAEEKQRRQAMRNWSGSNAAAREKERHAEAAKRDAQLRKLAEERDAILEEEAEQYAATAPSTVPEDDEADMPELQDTLSQGTLDSGRATPMTPWDPERARSVPASREQSGRGSRPVTGRTSPHSARSARSPSARALMPTSQYALSARAHSPSVHTPSVLPSKMLFKANHVAVLPYASPYMGQENEGLSIHHKKAYDFHAPPPLMSESSLPAMMKASEAHEMPSRPDSCPPGERPAPFKENSADGEVERVLSGSRSQRVMGSEKAADPQNRSASASATRKQILQDYHRRLSIAATQAPYIPSQEMIDIYGPPQSLFEKRRREKEKEKRVYSAPAASRGIRTTPESILLPQGAPIDVYSQPLQGSPKKTPGTKYLDVKSKYAGMSWWNENNPKDKDKRKESARDSREARRAESARSPVKGEDSYLQFAKSSQVSAWLDGVDKREAKERSRRLKNATKNVDWVQNKRLEAKRKMDQQKAESRFRTKVISIWFAARKIQKYAIKYYERKVGHPCETRKKSAHRVLNSTCHEIRVQVRRSVSTYLAVFRNLAGSRSPKKDARGRDRSLTC